MFGGLCAVVSKEKDLSSKLLYAGFCAGLFPRSLLMGSCWSGFYYRFKKKKKNVFYTLSESFLISRQLPQSAFCREPIFFPPLIPQLSSCLFFFQPRLFHCILNRQNLCFVSLFALLSTSKCRISDCFCDCVKTTNRATLRWAEVCVLHTHLNRVVRWDENTHVEVAIKWCFQRAYMASASSLQAAPYIANSLVHQGSLRTLLKWYRSWSSCFSLHCKSIPMTFVR